MKSMYWTCDSPLYKKLGRNSIFFYFKVLRTGQLLVSKVAQKPYPKGHPPLYGSAFQALPTRGATTRFVTHILTKFNLSSGFYPKGHPPLYGSIGISPTRGAAGRAESRGAKSRRRQTQRATGGVFWARRKSKTVIIVRACVWVALIAFTPSLNPRKLHFKCVGGWRGKLCFPLQVIISAVARWLHAVKTACLRRKKTNNV